MTKMKTLSLKLALSILVGVLAVVCLTASVVLAAFSVPSTTITSTVNIAKISAQVWSDATATTEITKSSELDSATELYISATKEGVAIDIPCVMRVSPTFNVTGVDTNKWIQQANGWYYYVGIVGGGYAGDYGTKSNDAIQFGTKSATTGGHISVELMQFSTSTTGGFIKEWSPLAGKKAKDAQLSSSTTIDGKSLVYNGDNCEDVYAAFIGDEYLPKTNFGAGDTGKDFSITTSADGWTNNEFTGDLAALYGTDGTKNLRFYNNSCVPLVAVVRITPDPNLANLSYEYSFGNKWLLKTLSSKTTIAVYNEAILPGQYVDIIGSSITITDSNTSASLATTIDFTINIDTVDVDTFNEELSDAKADAVSPTLYDLCKNIVGLNIDSPFRDWVNAMETYFDNNKENLTIGDFPNAGYESVSGTNEKGTQTTNDSDSQTVANSDNSATEQSSINTASFSGQVANP